MRRLLLAFALLFVALPACDDGVDHYKRALAIERELLRQDAEATYGHDRYIHVLRELAEVPGSSADAQAARALAARIQDGRRFALQKSIPDSGVLPDRLSHAKAPAPPKLAAGPATKAANPRPAATTAPPPAAPPATPEALARLKITLYSTSWCGYCRRARAWFTQMGYPFEEKDVERDAEASVEYRRKSGGYGGVPLIDVNGTVVRGFDQNSLQKVIGKVLQGS